MRRILPIEIMAVMICDRYSHKDVERHFAGKPDCSIAELLGYEAIPLTDRLWLALNLDIFPAPQQSFIANSIKSELLRMVEGNQDMKEFVERRISWDNLKANPSEPSNIYAHILVDSEKDSKVYYVKLTAKSEEFLARLASFLTKLAAKYNL